MSVFEVIGVMDERYFVYSDDVDFMYRAMRAGLKLYLLPEAKLWHKVSGLTGGALSEFSLYYGSRGRALFLYKHFGRLQGWFWTTLYSAFCWLRQFVGGDAPANSKTRIRGTRDGRRVGASRFLDLRLQ
jgi:GT2 family glycosyltransferase